MEEWYIGTGADDYAVLKEREESDRVLESWNQWGMNAPDSPWLTTAQYFANDSKPKGGLTSFMGKSLSFEREHQSSSSSVCEAVSSEAIVHNRPTMFQCQWPEQQLDDLEGIDEMDDIFLSSLLEDLPTTEDSRGSKCLKTHACSSSIDWESKEVTSSHYPTSMATNDCLALKPPVGNESVQSEQSRDDEQMVEETSMEESVLLDLETVMVQMTEKMRLCIRDALYRLAKSSKQLLNPRQPDGICLDRPEQSNLYEEALSSSRTETPEPETNTIDRAIANLMFSKMQLNSQDLPTISMNSEKGSISTKGTYNYTSHHPQKPKFPQSELPWGDAEVPI